MIGHDDKGNPFAMLTMQLHVKRGEDGVWKYDDAGWFRADTGEPLDLTAPTDLEELLRTRRALAENLCHELGIADEDLRETVIAVGRAATAGDGESRVVVINVANAAADEQRRRDATRLTPAGPPTTPTPDDRNR